MQSSCRTNTKALRMIMVDKGFNSIGNLAETAEISRITLGKVLSGKVQPSSVVIAKLIVALGIASEETGRIFFNRDLCNE